MGDPAPGRREASVSPRLRLAAHEAAGGGEGRGVFGGDLYAETMQIKMKNYVWITSYRKKIYLTQKWFPKYNIMTIKPLIILGMKKKEENWVFGFKDLKQTNYVYHCS